MTKSIRSREERLETALEAAGIAWWEIDFPSGGLSFSKYKTDMLGYDANDFYHYTKFTELLHPDDYDQAMDAMRDHIEGRCDYYETKYRIKASDESYKVFYDKGRIVERRDDGFIVAGIVMDITDGDNQFTNLTA